MIGITLPFIWYIIWHATISVTQSVNVKLLKKRHFWQHFIFWSYKIQFSWHNQTCELMMQAFINWPFYLAFRCYKFFLSRPKALFYTNFYLTPPPKLSTVVECRSFGASGTPRPPLGILYCCVFLRLGNVRNTEKKVCTKKVAHWRVMALERSSSAFLKSLSRFYLSHRSENPNSDL